MPPVHDRFEWDVRKAAHNLALHAVSFMDAARVLADSLAEVYHLENFDDEHSDEKEDRWITLASDPEARDVILFIVWTPRRNATRIISARHATKAERREYREEVRRRLGE